MSSIMSLLNFKWFFFTFCFLWNTKSYLLSSWLCFQLCVCLAIGRTDAKVEAPILWPPDVMNWLTGKHPDAGKDWRQEKGMTEDEMFRWHHRLDGHEFEQAWGAVDGQGSLACCCTLSHKELDRTEQLNWTELIAFVSIELFFPFFFLFWAPKFPFHLFFETLNLLIALCFKSERVQSYNFYARIKILSLTFCMF